MTEIYTLGRTCAHCVAFDLTKRSIGAGLCRFNPPTFINDPDVGSVWPLVDETDWCLKWVGRGESNTEENP